MDSGRLGIGAITELPERDPAAVRLDEIRSTAEWETTSYRIESDEPILAGLDGEALVFESPLNISIQPQGLRVLVPAGTQPGYACGLRRGEALALRWVDVDLDAKTLTVRATVNRIEGELVFSEPKSQASRRIIALPDVCVGDLHDHRRTQLRERLASHKPWPEDDLVFPSSVGTVMEPRNLTRQFHKLCEQAGIEQRRFHDLRHTCATLLLAQGVSARVAMDILGHSRLSTTLEIYSHVGVELQRDAAMRIDNALRIGGFSDV